MSIITLIYIYCDGCTDDCIAPNEAAYHAPTPNHSAARQREELVRREGWVNRGSQDFCPACARALGYTKEPQQEQRNE